MENWGLITYRETNLLYDVTQSSSYNKQRVASVIAHELVHQVSPHCVFALQLLSLWHQTFQPVRHKSCAVTLVCSCKVGQRLYYIKLLFNFQGQDSKCVMPLVIRFFHLLEHY